MKVGTYAIISLMVYSTIQKLELKYVESDAFLHFKQNLSVSLENDTFDSRQIDDHIMKFRIKVSTSLAFCCGIVQVSKILLLFSIELMTKKK